MHISQLIFASGELLIKGRNVELHMTYICIYMYTCIQEKNIFLDTCNDM